MTDGILGDPDPLDEIVAAWWKFEGWDRDEKKDRALAARILEMYPTLNVLEEINAWEIWMLDHDPKGKGVRVRARFNTWCRNAVRFAGSGSKNRGVRTANGRPGTRARGPAEFGDTSERSSSW